MRKLGARRLRNVCLLLIASSGVMLLCSIATTALRDTARASGWLLAGLVLFLALYNLRKKLPVLPLGSSSAWLQLHIYAGLFTAVVFASHVGWRMPDGIFESVLALLYGCVFMSGVTGLFLSRSFARRLTTRGEEVLFERIPVHRRHLATQVESIVLDCVDKTESIAVAEFYAQRLQPFFAEARNFWHHVMHSNRPRFALLNELQSHNRFLREGERTTMDEIVVRIKAKDDLDYQYALQATLKYWLFLHVPLTYALLVFVLFHLLLVSAFTGGAP